MASNHILSFVAKSGILFGPRQCIMIYHPFPCPRPPYPTPNIRHDPPVDLWHPWALPVDVSTRLHSWPEYHHGSAASQHTGNHRCSGRKSNHLQKWLLSLLFEILRWPRLRWIFPTRDSFHVRWWLLCTNDLMDDFTNFFDGGFLVGGLCAVTDFRHSNVRRRRSGRA